MAFVPRAILVAVALAVGPALIATALLLLVHPWTADAAYALPGFPEPRIALDDDERSRLAAVGTRAIAPWWPDGMETMRAATHADGRPAFVGEEIRHFEDVRTVVLVFLLAGAAGLAVIVAGAALVRDRSVMRRGLIAGTRVTVALFAAIGALMLIGFDAFFDAFHWLFFDGESWRLPYHGTVRSLYPDALWAVIGGALVALVLAQAAAIVVSVRSWTS